MAKQEYTLNAFQLQPVYAANLVGQHLSDPQPTWLFNITFESTSDNTNTLFFNKAIKEGRLIPLSIDLPSHTTEIIQRNYFGSEKSFPVLRKYGGDSTIQFDVRNSAEDNMDLYVLSQAINRMSYSEQPELNSHPEFQTLYSIDKICVQLIDKAFGKQYNQDTNSTANSSYTPQSLTKYIYHNCIITNFSFESNLAYANDNTLKAKLTFHYDIWSIS